MLAPYGWSMLRAALTSRCVGWWHNSWWAAGFSGQFLPVKEAMAGSGPPVLQFFGFVGSSYPPYYIHALLCEIFGRCIFLHFCIFGGSSLPLCEVTPPFQQDGVQLPRWTSPCRVVKCVGEYPFGMFPFVLAWSHPAQPMEKLRVRFSAIRCDGERQLYLIQHT